MIEHGDLQSMEAWKRREVWRAFDLSRATFDIPQTKTLQLRRYETVRFRMARPWDVENARAMKRYSRDSGFGGRREGIDEDIVDWEWVLLESQTVITHDNGFDRRQSAEGVHKLFLFPSWSLSSPDHGETRAIDSFVAEHPYVPGECP